MEKATIILVVPHTPSVVLGRTIRLSVSGCNLYGGYTVVRCTHRYDNDNAPVTVLHLARQHRD